MRALTIKTVASTGAALAFVLAGPVGSVSASQHTSNGSGNPHNKVTICHATGSKTNPYVAITPDVNGIVNGHYAHQDFRDIIPSFHYNDRDVTKTFAGQNLNNGGQAILDNGCVVPGQSGGSNNGGGQGGGQVLGSTTETSKNTIASLPNTSGDKKMVPAIALASIVSGFALLCGKAIRTAAKNRSIV